MAQGKRVLLRCIQVSLAGGFFGCVLVAFAALVPGVRAQDAATGATATTGGTIRVHIVGLRNDRGHIGCLLYAAAAGFPGDPDRSLQKTVGRLGRDHRTATCTFRDVPAGRYAVTFGHDENGNRTLDTNLIGLPIEGWGVSNDAPARFGPPEYADAAFDFDGRRKLVVASMRYGL
ncbi:MAG: hypothetical protein DRJ42_16985 [Deltaproteobacteria bacterium]|nr:MAG: hypothetical protein DRJ42_16985 [Deltaproteobacteria bacterium]